MNEVISYPLPVRQKRFQIGREVWLATFQLVKPKDGKPERSHYKVLFDRQDSHLTDERRILDLHTTINMIGSDENSRQIIFDKMQSWLESCERKGTLTI